MATATWTEKPMMVRSGDGTAVASFCAGEGPPLVLVHGTTADHTRWAGVLDALAGRFTVYAMDRRGRGASGDTPEYRLAREVDDVVAVCEAAGPGVTLLGHSYGALCALEAALRTSVLSRLVLYEPPLPDGTPMTEPGVLARIETLIAAGNREGALVTFMRDVVGLSEADLATVRSLPVWRARLAAAHTIGREARIENAYRFDPRRFAAIEVPTLLLQGGSSPAFLVRPLASLADAIPQARVTVMPGQGHAAMDTGPDLFLEAVLSFVDATDGP